MNRLLALSNSFPAWIFGFFFLACTTNEPEPVEPEWLRLNHVDIDGAFAVFQFDDTNGKNLLKVSESGVITPLILTFEGNYTERQSKSFDITNVPYSDYLILTSEELEQTYFVNKKTGDAVKSTYFRFDIWYNGLPRVACTGNVCYYGTPENETMKITEFLSENAVIEKLPVNLDGSLFVDASGELFVYGYTGLHSFKDEKLQKLTDKPAGVWLEADGYLRMIDKEGIISKIVGTNIETQGAIPHSIDNMGAHKLATRQKTFGVQYRYQAFQCYELNAPYEHRKTFSIPEHPAEFEALQHIVSSNENYIFIYSFERGMNQVIRKIDVTDFSSTLITTTSKDNIGCYLPLNNDKLLVVIDKYEHFSSTMQPAIIDSDGNVEFLFGVGNTNFPFIKL